MVTRRSGLEPGVRRRIWDGMNIRPHFNKQPLVLFSPFGSPGVCGRSDLPVLSRRSCLHYRVFPFLTFVYFFDIPYSIHRLTSNSLFFLKPSTLISPLDHLCFSNLNRESLTSIDKPAPLNSSVRCSPESLRGRLSPCNSQGRLPRTKKGGTEFDSCSPLTI